MRLAALTAIPLLATALVFAPVTQVFFHGDDFLILHELVTRPLGTFVLTPTGGHLLLVRNLVAAATFAVFGPEPTAFFWSAFLTHLACVWLLFRFLVVVTARPALAAAGALLWGTCHVHEGTLGWYAVYGQALATLAILATLYDLARVAAEDRPLTRARCLAWCGLLAVAATSFGVGLGVALAFPAVVWLVLPPGPARRRAVGALASLWVVLPLLYWFDLVLYARLRGEAPETVTAQLVFGPSPAAVLTMLTDLVRWGVALVTCGFWDRRPAPGTWNGDGLVLEFVLVLLIALWRGGRLRRWAGAGLGLALVAYGTIAVARTALLLQLFRDSVTAAGELRYHYVGPLFLTVTGVTAIAGMLPAPGTRTRAADMTVLGLAIFVLAGWWQSDWQIERFDALRAGVAGVTRAITAGVDARPPGPVFIRNQPFRALKARQIIGFPGWAGIFRIFIRTNPINDRRVYFLERNEKWLADDHVGPPETWLLVSPADLQRRPGPLNATRP